MMDRSDLELFEASLRSVTAKHTAAALDDALVEIGWADALEVDLRASVSILFDLQGRAAATSSALDHLLLMTLAVDGSSGMVLPRLRSWGPSAVVNDEGVAIVDGLSSSLAARGETLVAVADVDGKSSALRVETESLDTRPAKGIDPAFGITVVQGRATGEHLATVNWPAAVRIARLALGHELVGASRTMLELAREHALERIQFGVPIASFQAVRHRLADALVAIEMAEAALDAAWRDDAPHHASIAKALAGRGARTTARHCQQVLAGIGYTLEHPFHHYLRRVLVLDELFGSARALTTELGAQVLRDGRLPAQIEL